MKGKTMIGRAAVGACAFALCTGFASGAVPATTMTWFSSIDGGSPATYNVFDIADYSTHHGPGQWTFGGSLGGPASGNTWALNWQVEQNSLSSHGSSVAGGSPAFVTADLEITNFTASTQVFWALVTVALDNPILGGTFISGSATAAVNGFGGSPASVFNPTSGPFAGDPAYTGLIDGNDVRTMFDSFSLSTPGGPVSTSTTFGMPTPEIGPDAIGTISVWLKLEVTAFATASITGTFYVAPIPAPAGISLLAVAMFGVRRRRN